MEVNTSRKTFRFDTNKCVGCHACVVACVIENKTDLPLNWREINTFNQFHYPNLAIFHYSLACNHCADAPCMHNCPALAYTRDLLSGAVTHNETIVSDVNIVLGLALMMHQNLTKQKGLLRNVLSALHVPAKA